MPDRNPPRRWWRFCCVVAVVACTLAGAATGARAQGFSSREGYAPDGGYQVFIELSPYAFLSRAEATVNGLGPRGNGGTSGSISAWKLLNSLDGAFFGNGIVRYGPYSAELNAVYVGLSSSRIFAAPGKPLNVTGHISSDATLVEAGFGYRVYGGGLAGMDSSVDARIGARYLSWNAHSSTASDILGGSDASGDSAAPYLGMRMDLYPTPKWRLRLQGDIEGFGTNNNAWGWQGALTGSYLVTKWLDASLGIAVYNVAAERDVGNPDGTSHRQTMHLLAYGPMLGFGLRF
jgi:hypothetical protein